MHYSRIHLIAVMLSGMLSKTLNHRLNSVLIKATSVFDYKHRGQETSKLRLDVFQSYIKVAEKSVANKNNSEDQ